VSEEYFFVSDVFPSLVNGLQENAIKEADQLREKDRQAYEALRREHGAGLSSSELARKLLGPSEEEQLEELNQKLDADEKESAAKAAAKEKEYARQTHEDRFPEPPLPAGVG
jgi:hypothetical protein